MRSPNVSVTPINVEPLPNGDIQRYIHILENHNNLNCCFFLIILLRHSTTTHVLHEPQRTHSAPHPAALTNGDMLDSSDAEVAQIEFQSSGRVNLRTKKNDVPRPMSWEGELSDGERDMCIDEDHGSQVRKMN